MIFENGRVYDVLKFIATRIGPIVVFLTALVDIWDIPYGAQITATLAALELLLSSFVVASKAKYTKLLNSTDAIKGEEDDAIQEQK